MNFERAYTTYGDPQRPAIVLVHGIRLGRDIWSSHAHALASTYFVVTVDLPGHGALWDVAFTEANITTLFEHVVHNVCASAPLLVGYSLGGYCVMEYAERKPDGARALLIAGATLDFENWKRWPYDVSARLSQMLPARAFLYVSHWMLRASLPRAWADLIDTIAFNRKVLSETTTLAAESSRFSGKLGRYGRPVLFVNGEYDLVFRMDERRFLQRVPQARLRIIRGVDHTAPLRRLHEFVEIVREFADRVFETAR